ncbi:MAG: response regulator [Cyanobacteriota bacterium]
MSNPRKRITILLAEDALTNQSLMELALKRSRLTKDLHIVQDGEELLDYLHHRRQYSELASSPRPDLILLDWHLPKIDGAQALQAIKSDPNLRRIPIVVMTSFKSEEDIRLSYQLGASSFFTKPVAFDSLVEAVNILGEYWFDIVELPPASTDE